MPKKTFARRQSMTGLEWRITRCLLDTLFSLSRAYFIRGSPRESEYFAQQAQDLAESLNAPAMISRALARKAEIQIQQRKFEDSSLNLAQAADLLKSAVGVDAADISRLRGDYNQLQAIQEGAKMHYTEATQILEDLEKLLALVDASSHG